MTIILNKYDVRVNMAEPYCHQHNGLVERVQQTIPQRIRALLYESGFPENMWGFWLKQHVGYTIELLIQRYNTELYMNNFTNENLMLARLKYMVPTLMSLTKRFQRAKNSRKGCVM